MYVCIYIYIYYTHTYIYIICMYMYMCEGAEMLQAPQLRHWTLDEVSALSCPLRSCCRRVVFAAVASESKGNDLSCDLRFLLLLLHLGLSCCHPSIGLLFIWGMQLCNTVTNVRCLWQRQQQPQNEEKTVSYVVGRNAKPYDSKSPTIVVPLLLGVVMRCW